MVTNDSNNLKGRDNELIEKINGEIVNDGEEVKFDSIVGLEDVKKAVYRQVIDPIKRPNLFTGSRAPSKGLLLFGPPGTGE